MFNKVCSFENLYQAYIRARRCKRQRDYVLEFDAHAEENLLALKNELKEGNYCHGGYKEMVVCDSKKRLIKVAPFRDRIVHHALCAAIEPIFDKGFIFDTYACRNGKGTHSAVKKLQQFLRQPEARYCLKCDISKYFASIDHEILYLLICEKITDENTLKLIRKIIDSSYDRLVYEDLFTVRKTGIPIGNLTSQLFANIYLSELDNFVKHKLREKFYLRYMDDFLVLGNEKLRLGRIKSIIRQFLSSRMRLVLHPKKAEIFPVRGGVDFLGYKVFINYRLLRKSTVRRFLAKYRRGRKLVSSGKMEEKTLRDSVRSWLAYAKFGNSWKLRQELQIKWLK
ncbi:MAG: reverse transcriptase/maturase family protein [Patescibacteria group bacterium]|nr:reverse transcriptase/maturase family protein [Patescibacteria group bacterium]